MRRKRSRLSRFALATWALTALAFACANGEIEPEPSVDPTGAADLPLTRCTDPRPQMCTRDYRPACGHRCAEPPCEDRGTYGNACTACADPEVYVTTPGSCESGPPERRPHLR